MNWIKLETDSQLSQLIDESSSYRTIIFKHSTRCGISSMVLRRFEKQMLNTDELRYYFLDLIAFRSISNKVAESFHLKHESPQLLIIENGSLVHHASHSNISHDSVISFVKE